ncbi:MAG: hypothetical protein NTY39_03700 [Campylobacterales bacterium]|nr:hypothetical protein [Campylobacterales bacterium]
MRYLIFVLSLSIMGCGDTASIEILEVNNNAQNKNSVIVIGKITPPDGMLSISYSGECGQSYYHDVETVEGVFIQTVDTTFIRDIDLFLSTPNNAEASKFIHLIPRGQTPKKHEKECDYLALESGYENHPVAYVVEESCYDIGVKYGSCVSRQHLNIACKAGTDISIPFRCRDRLDTKAGIEAGRI